VALRRKHLSFCVQLISLDGDILLGNGEELRQVIHLLVAASELVTQVGNLRIGTRKLLPKVSRKCPIMGVM
jgi:hypothetical protein